MISLAALFIAGGFGTLKMSAGVVIAAVIVDTLSWYYAKEIFKSRGEQ